MYIVNKPIKSLKFIVNITKQYNLLNFRSV
ncbi:MAG: hypothetical protein JWQ63_3236 [Mucilaginibacter sp.]|jgi:hypothetical protein|nr:hypothetical protein [Mucilaginibacter sp.]